MIVPDNMLQIVPVGLQVAGENVPRFVLRPLVHEGSQRVLRAEPLVTANRWRGSPAPDIVALVCATAARRLVVAHEAGFGSWIL